MSRRRRRERGYDETGELIREITNETLRRSLRRRRRRGRGGFFGRLIKTWVWIVVATAIILPSMIGNGWFIGVRGLLALPLVLFATWGTIAYLNLFRKPAASLPANPNTSVALLPAQTDSWLETQRELLPALVQGQLDSISSRLEGLTPQLRNLGAEAPGAAEVRKLLSEELPELVRGYQKVPAALRTQPLHGGLSPERQLVEGLTTIDEQIGRLQEQLAANDLHALATHQRYLELKYKRDDADE